jgi:hypothetical protein
MCGLNLNDLNTNSYLFIDFGLDSDYIFKNIIMVSYEI